MNKETVITTNKLTKKFGDFIAANELTFDVRCCEDFQSQLTVISDYVPQFFQINSAQTENQTLFFRNILLSETQFIIPNFYSTGYPPGNLRKGLTQPEVCVFRI